MRRAVRRIGFVAVQMIDIPLIDQPQPHAQHNACAGKDGRIVQDGEGHVPHRFPERLFRHGIIAVLAS